jgi:hypothetical protein
MMYGELKLSLTHYYGIAGLPHLNPSQMAARPTGGADGYEQEWNVAGVEGSRMAADRVGR